MFFANPLIPTYASIFLRERTRALHRAHKNIKYEWFTEDTAIEASSDGEGEKVRTREREQDLFLRKTLSPLSSNSRASKSLPTLAHDIFLTVHKTVPKQNHADRSNRSNENDAEYDLH